MGESGAPWRARRRINSARRPGAKRVPSDVAASILVDAPPADLVEPLVAELFPRQRGGRLEPNGNRHVVILVALAVPVAVDEFDGSARVSTRVDRCSCRRDRPPREAPDANAVTWSFARVEAPAWQRPDRRGRELEADEQDRVVGRGQHRAHGLTDPQRGHVSGVGLVDRGVAVDVVAEGLVHLVDVLAFLTDRQLLWILRGNPRRTHTGLRTGVPMTRASRTSAAPFLRPGPALTMWAEVGSPVSVSWSGDRVEVDLRHRLEITHGHSLARSSVPGRGDGKQ